MKNYDLKNFANGKDPRDTLVQLTDFAIKEPEAQSGPVPKVTDSLAWHWPRKLPVGENAYTWESERPLESSQSLKASDASSLHQGSRLLSAMRRDEQLEEPSVERQSFQFRALFFFH